MDHYDFQNLGKKIPALFRTLRLGGILFGQTSSPTLSNRFVFFQGFDFIPHLSQFIHYSIKQCFDLVVY